MRAPSRLLVSSAVGPRAPSSPARTTQGAGGRKGVGCKCNSHQLALHARTADRILGSCPISRPVIAVWTDFRVPARRSSDLPVVLAIRALRRCGYVNQGLAPSTPPAHGCFFAAAACDLALALQHCFFYHWLSRERKPPGDDCGGIEQSAVGRSRAPPPSGPAAPERRRDGSSHRRYLFVEQPACPGAPRRYRCRAAPSPSTCRLALPRGRLIVTSRA